MSTTGPLSNVQQELMKLFSADIDEADLLHIKIYPANDFANKSIDEADKIWTEREYTNETMNQWLNEEKLQHVAKKMWVTKALVSFLFRHPKITV